MSQVGDIDWKLVFVTQSQTLDTDTDSEKIYKLDDGSNVHFKANDPSTANFVLELNDISRGIAIGDICKFYHGAYILFSGYVLSREMDVAGNKVNLSVGDPLILIESAKIIPDDPVVPDDTTFVEDEIVGIVKTDGIYTTTITGSGTVNQPLTRIEVLNTTTKNLSSFCESGFGSYSTAFNNGGAESACKVSFTGKNSVCEKVAVQMQSDDGDTVANHTLEIVDANGNSVWSTTSVLSTTSPAWYSYDVNTRLEGGKQYYLRFYANAADAGPTNNVVRWLCTTQVGNEHGSVSTDSMSSWKEWWNQGGTPDYILSCFNFEIQYESDWTPKVEGKHFTVNYSTRTITWGGSEGYIPSFDNKTKENTAGSDYNVCRESFTKAGLTTKSLMRYAMNSYGRDPKLFKYYVEGDGLGNGQNWNPYIIAQQSLLTTLKDAASLDKIEFRSRYHE